MLARQVPPVSHGSPLEEEAGDEITPIRAALYLPRCLRRFTNCRSRWLYAPPANHHPWRFVQPCSAFHGLRKEGPSIQPGPKVQNKEGNLQCTNGIPAAIREWGGISTAKLRDSDRGYLGCYDEISVASMLIARPGHAALV